MEEERQFFTINVQDNQEYAIDINHIIEIKPKTTLYDIPDKNSNIKGFMKFRNEVIYVQNLDSLLNKSHLYDISNDNFIVIIKIDNETFGVGIKNIGEIVKEKKSNLEENFHSKEKFSFISTLMKKADNTITQIIDTNALNSFLKENNEIL